MNRSKIVRVSLILFLGVVWFIAVDWSWFVHDCPDCWHGEDTAQYRVFTVPIHTTVYKDSSVIQQVATDLGKPCMHPNMESWHKHRRWGLLFCKSPCINGIYRLTGESTWYDQAAAAKIVALSERKPSLKTEFHDRVFIKHDYKFLPVVLDQAGVDHPIPD
ncbi:hypothetical protein [Gimesia sp.]|uniref:hypothetical protein n=1 Tax=Gimesia sp. TaxID=2024833 RepID=UPI003A92AC25